MGRMLFLMTLLHRRQRHFTISHSKCLIRTEIQSFGGVLLADAVRKCSYDYVNLCCTIALCACGLQRALFSRRLTWSRSHEELQCGMRGHQQPSIFRNCPCRRPWPLPGPTTRPIFTARWSRFAYSVTRDGGTPWDLGLIPELWWESGVPAGRRRHRRQRIAINGRSVADHVRRNSSKDLQAESFWIWPIHVQRAGREDVSTRNWVVDRRPAFGVQSINSSSLDVTSTLTQRRDRRRPSSL